MDQGRLDERITIRLHRYTKANVLEQARYEGVTMTDLVRTIVNTYINYKQRTISR